MHPGSNLEKSNNFAVLPTGYVKRICLMLQVYLWIKFNSPDISVNKPGVNLAFKAEFYTWKH